MRRRFLLLVLIGLLFVGCQLSLGQQRRQVDRLSRSFTTLEQLRVEGYGNEEWCQYITYRRGRFAEKLQPWNCNLFREAPQPFDAQAQRDFEQVERAIAPVGFKIYRILNLKYAPNGSIVGASFTFEASGLPGSASQYVYAPAYKALPPDNLDLDFSAVNQDWYSISYNWN